MNSNSSLTILNIIYIFLHVLFNIFALRYFFIIYIDNVIKQSYSDFSNIRFKTIVQNDLFYEVVFFSLYTWNSWINSNPIFNNLTTICICLDMLFKASTYCGIFYYLYWRNIQTILFRNLTIKSISRLLKFL